MDAKTFIEFLLNSATTNPVINDLYWNNVKLLLRLDKEANTLGLPLYRDYSRYQYPVREWMGASPDSRILFPSNPSADYPTIAATADIDMKSFCYIANRPNHILRTNQLNSGVFESQLKPSYLEVMCAGVENLHLGTGDFTIEFSFFADELNLPWRWQTLWTVGQGVLRLDTTTPTIDTLKTYIKPTNVLSGWGCFLKDNNIVFVGTNWEIQLNTSPLQKLTWYHICLQRTNSVLKIFINSTQTKTVSFGEVLTTNNSISFDNRVLIGVSQPYTGVGLSSFTLFTTSNAIDTSFSGGFTNFRITAAARYPSTFYTVRLPHAVLAVDNKIDDYYSNVLFNLPISYDFYNYAPNHAHFKNKTYLKSVPSIQTGFLPITGKNSYETKSANSNLNSNWTIEFFICQTVNGEPFIKYPSGYVNSSLKEQTFAEWLYEYSVAETTPGDFATSINLLSLKSNNKKVIDINFNVVKSRRLGVYFSVKASSNGDDWLNFPVDEDIDWNAGTGELGYYPYPLPNNEIKFFPSYLGAELTSLPIEDGADTNIIPSGFNSSPKHLAISKYNNMLYILIDGKLIRTVPFNYSLYSFTNNLTLTICGEGFEDVLGSRTQDSTISRLSVALKGIRVTNAARYSFINNNDVHYLNTVQPLPLTNDVIPPSRARIIDILKTTDKTTISATEVTWDVFLSQPVDDLLLADFTLTGTGGISNYSLTSITKASEYRYVVTANTGQGNGELSLNFIDRRTVKYKGKNTFISYFPTELNVEGESYSINKNAPIPYLTSGSNPYVATSFIVRLSFDAAISTFNSSHIGLVNGTISNIIQLDEFQPIYDITIQPIKEGLVIVQCMEGVGVTDSNLPSIKSAPFVRIFSNAFPILQTPLNIANTITDLSPSNVVLDDVIDNNVEFSNSIYPIGENSSMYINPVAEKSGLRKIGFNAVGSTINTTNSEWTIEFFLRINSANKTAHILSVENAATGFAVVCNNGQLRIQRSIGTNSNLLGSLTMADKETTSFVEWNNNSFTQLEKYPHFAITYKNGVYRFYRNGKRIGLLQSSVLIDITKGNLYIGYYPNRITDSDYYLSNVRFTLGKALYTAFEVNIPSLPFTIPPNITDSAEVLNYISIFSNNNQSNIARTGDTVTLKFSSIITLTSTPSVTILNKNTDVVVDKYGVYTASIQITEDDVDGQIPFTITVANQPNIPTKLFTSSTNNSSVFVDNTPLEASITSDSVNDSSYTINAFITFTEPIRGFSVNDLVADNCLIGNFKKIANSNRYSFTITGISSGDISIKLPANKVQDLAGNYNLESNTFSRTVVVPSYVPDIHFNNVLLLLQPTNTIIDESNFNIPLIINNVELTDIQTPQGLSKSMYFNGENSSINFDLNSTLNGNQPYTIEFFIYFKSKVVFRLSSPRSLPASVLQTSSFKANWEGVENASSYSIDVSKQANFSTFVSGYKDKNVGNTLSTIIANDKLDTIPTLKNTRLVSSTGFVPEWSFPQDTLGFRYDVSLTTDFSKKLYNYSDKITTTKYSVIGDITNASVLDIDSSSNIDNSDETPYNVKQGSIITGILGTDTYPSIYYFLEEGSVRLYPSDGYILPIVAEDIDALEWYHIAITNDIKYTYLYVNGECIDRIRNTSFDNSMKLGYSIGHFYGFLTGLRITKGVNRYKEDKMTVPLLPFSKD